MTYLFHQISIYSIFRQKRKARRCIRLSSIANCQLQSQKFANKRIIDIKSLIGQDKPVVTIVDQSCISILLD